MAIRGSQDARYVRAIELLRQARRAARMSQTELAAKLGTRQQFVSKYESGERRLDFIEFLDVARALGLEPETILKGLG